MPPASRRDTRTACSAFGRFSWAATSRTGNSDGPGPPSGAPTSRDGAGASVWGSGVGGAAEGVGLEGASPAGSAEEVGGAADPSVFGLGADADGAVDVSLPGAADWGGGGGAPGRLGGDGSPEPAWAKARRRAHIAARAAVSEASQRSMTSRAGSVRNYSTQQMLESAVHSRRSGGRFGQRAGAQLEELLLLLLFLVRRRREAGLALRLVVLGLRLGGVLLIFVPLFPLGGFIAHRRASVGWREPPIYQGRPSSPSMARSVTVSRESDGDRLHATRFG